MKFLWRLAGLLVAIVVITFAISNRTATMVDLWPLPWQLTVPVYAVVLIAVALGVGAGGIGAWRAGGRTRSAARGLRRQVSDLRAENETLRRGKTVSSDKSTLPTTR